MVNSAEDSPVYVRFDRRKALASVLLFAAVMAVGVSRAHRASGIVILVVVLSIPLIYFLTRVLRQGPVFVLGDAKFTDCKSGESYLWDDVFEVYLRQRQGIFGVYHHLVFTIRREPGVRDLDILSSSQMSVQTLRRSIDQMSIGWSDIVALVQQRLGKDIPTRREAGPFRKPVA